MRNPKTPRRVRRGSGIVEVVVSTALVGVMIVAALNAIGMVFRTRHLNADRLTGPTLAQDLITEILSMPYEDPELPGGPIGLETGENRATFDDVDDYHNWTATEAVARNGDDRDGYEGWDHEAAVEWVNPTTGAVSVSETGLKRITVTVTSPAGVASELVALRSRYGALEQTMPIAWELPDEGAVSWIGVELRTGTGTGASTRSQYAAAPILNHVQDAN